MAAPPATLKHVWAYVSTAQVGSAPPAEKYSDYRCLNCDVTFRHFYALKATDLYAAIDQAYPEKSIPLCSQTNKEGGDVECSLCEFNRLNHHEQKHLFNQPESSRISIRGLDKPALLQPLVANAKPTNPAMAALSAMMPPTLSREAAEFQLEQDLYVDYCYCRCIKVDFRRDDVDPRLYDRE